MQSNIQPNQNSREANLITAYTDVWELKKEVKSALANAQNCENLQLRNELKIEALQLNYKAECLLKEVLDCVDPVKGILLC